MSEMSMFSIDFDMSSTENGMLHQINKELRVKTEMCKPCALLTTCFISKSSTTCSSYNTYITCSTFQGSYFRGPVLSDMSNLLQEIDLFHYFQKLELSADLESSSKRKELLTALFESSVISTRILDITWLKPTIYIATCQFQQAE